MDAIDSPPESAPLKCRWYQYRLRTLLILTLLCAVACSFLRVRWEKARQQQDAAECIVACGGTLYYERHGVVTVAAYDFSGAPTSFSFDCGHYGCPWDYQVLDPPSWTERAFGPYYARRIVSVDLSRDQVAEALPHLKRLPHLRAVYVCPVNSNDDPETNAAMQRLRDELPGVESCSVIFDFGITVGDDGERNIATVLLQCARDGLEDYLQQLGVIAACACGWPPQVDEYTASARLEMSLTR
jgi:hypothetical protein